MMDLISREALIDFIDPGHLRHPGELCFSEIDVVNMLNHSPTIDAVPVVHGEWSLAFTEEENVWKCSNCDEYWLLNHGTPFDNEMNFCPRCGADMRKGGNNE